MPVNFFFPFVFLYKKKINSIQKFKKNHKKKYYVEKNHLSDVKGGRV